MMGLIQDARPAKIPPAPEMDERRSGRKREPPLHRSPFQPPPTVKQKLFEAQAAIANCIVWGD
ncbi:uncharacterized protein BP01DRAFT_358303, partial [Aspergillus saccharolyticus JOP 1030-1]